MVYHSIPWYRLFLRYNCMDQWWREGVWHLGQTFVLSPLLAQGSRRLESVGSSPACVWGGIGNTMKNTMVFWGGTYYHGTMYTVPYQGIKYRPEIPWYFLPWYIMVLFEQGGLESILSRSRLSER